MPPRDKAKAAGVSASSFLDLKAELARFEEQTTKNNLSGKAGPVVLGDGGSKKISQWAKQNKGVNSRAARDIVELEAVSRPTLESARAALERKAKIYDKLKKGRSGGLSEAQYDALLVDFDSKEPAAFESDSEDEDESLAIPKPPEQDDPIVEYEDEFGRTRVGRRSDIPSHLRPITANPDEDPMVEYEDEFGRIRQARRSEVPREFLRQIEKAVEDDDPSIIYNPTNYFPVYQPDAARVAAVQAELAEANNPLNMHYDASREVRAKGAGFYQFSGDAETRARQMEELKASRTDTVRARQEVGAVDVLPSEATEGLNESVAGKSRAMDKRKREIEERRKMLDAKRKKAKLSDTGSPETIFQTISTSTLAATPTDQLRKDPFAALEEKASQKSAPQATVSAADNFLAQLEKEIQGRQ